MSRKFPGPAIPRLSANKIENWWKATVISTFWKKEIKKNKRKGMETTKKKKKEERNKNGKRKKEVAKAIAVHVRQDVVCGAVVVNIQRKVANKAGMVPD